MSDRQRTIGPTPERRKGGKRISSEPGYDGAFEVGSRLVDDPYEPGNKIAVPFNVRHDPLARMLLRGEIDETQYKAGNDLRACIERMGGSGAPAVDLSKEAVDGGKIYGGISESTMKAAKKPREAHAVLGWQSYRLVRAVVCDGLNGSLIAQQSRAQVDRKAVQAQVRRGLEQLAILWNYISDPASIRTRASMVSMMQERPGWNYEESEANIVMSYPPSQKS